MFSYIWHTFFFDPIYNGLVFFINSVPNADVGIAIILITIVVKTVLLPLSLKAARTQKIMRELEPKLKVIKEKFKDKREEQAREMMALYKEVGLNPFASVLLLLIQIPLIIALYLSVYQGGGVALPAINTDILYSFVLIPEKVNMIFLGLIDIAQKSLPLALLAGATQFIHAQLAFPKPEPRKENEVPDFKSDFARSMQLQMRYVLPIIITVVAYLFSGAVALYFTVSNIFQIGQELFIRRKNS